MQQKLDALSKAIDEADSARRSSGANPSQAGQGASAGGPVAPGRVVTKQDDDAIARYLKAIQAVVTSHWVRPPGLAKAPCLVHITQLRGGDVINAEVDASCPYDALGRKAAEEAVMQSSPLPYNTFESVFQRRIDFTFHADP
ncbi:cell envelope integrity protein TolA [Dyella soli]|nr:TonB C-terminal domain-containing protein [Dyella soli]